jgi:hypothetical protein
MDSDLGQLLRESPLYRAEQISRRASDRITVSRTKVLIDP